MKQFESFDSPEFVDLGDGRTGYAPESGVGIEGTLVNPFEQANLREQLIAKMSGELGSLAVMDNMDE